MLFGWAGDTICVEEPVWVDDRGKKTKTYPGTDVVDVEGCSVQPVSSSSDWVGRDNVQIDLVVFAPAGTKVTRHAKVTVEGEGYRVEGVPGAWKSPTGGMDHVEISLVRWEG